MLRGVLPISRNARLGNHRLADGASAESVTFSQKPSDKDALIESLTKKLRRKSLLTPSQRQIERRAERRISATQYSSRGRFTRNLKKPETNSSPERQRSR